MPTPNTVKYSPSFVTGTIGLNNMYLGVSNSVIYGPTSTTDFWNGYTPGTNGYTVYIRKDVNGPSIYSPSSDSELIDTARRISQSREESPTLSTTADAISYLNSKSDMICVNADYPSIVTDGLVLHLDSAFTPSYPKGGTGWKDLSSSSKTATLTNGVSYLSSNSGSLSYSSSSLQYVDVPDLGSLSNFTVSCWFKLNTLPTTAGAAAVVANVYDGSVLNFSIGLNRSPTSSNICGGFYSGSWRTTDGFSPATGSWYNTAVTYDGTQIIQYLSGSQQSTLNYTGTPTSSGQGIRIGRRWDSTPSSVDFINGEIPQVSVYNRALTSDEILSNYNAYKIRFYTTYTYYRWQITQAKTSPPQANCVQASEFVFQLDGVDQSMSGVTVTNPNGNNPVGEEPSKLIDGLLTTKGLDLNFVANGSITNFIFQFSSAKAFNGYRWATANDEESRDPKSWTISGSNDGSTWTTLHTVSGFTATSARDTWQTAQTYQT